LTVTISKCEDSSAALETRFAGSQVNGIELLKQHPLQQQQHIYSEFYTQPSRHVDQQQPNRFLYIGHVHHRYVVSCETYPAITHLKSDEIEFAPPKPPVKDILGGAGSYSALGARIFSPPPKSNSVGWIVDCGSDFPSELRQFISQWQTGVVIRETPDRLTTRGWNGYGEHEHRGKY
jgi:hypothetical protein